jgi:cation transport ATPase
VALAAWRQRDGGTGHPLPLVVTALLCGVCCAWQPLPALAWSAVDAMAKAALWAAWGLGWVLLAHAGWRLARAEQHARRLGPDGGTRSHVAALAQAAAGFALVNWSIPSMTAGQFVFASAATVYLVWCAGYLLHRYTVARSGAYPRR